MFMAETLWLMFWHDDGTLLRDFTVISCLASFNCMIRGTFLRQIVTVAGLSPPRSCRPSLCLPVLEHELRLQAMLDILRILTAILALGLGAWLFNRDTKRLVLVPIDRMMQKARRAEPHNII